MKDTGCANRFDKRLQHSQKEPKSQKTIKIDSQEKMFGRGSLARISVPRLSMKVDEVEVYVTPDGHGRAAIVRRADGLFCIYHHYRGFGSWIDDEDPVLLRYDDPNPDEVAEPEIGIYGTVDDARRSIKASPSLSAATLKLRK